MPALFNDIYKNTNVFVTGHTGFKGSWLCLWLRRLGAHVTGFAREPATDPSHFSLLQPDMTSVTGDVADREHLVQAVRESEPAIVFHCAAQPLVRYSYRHPHETYMSNVMGTLNICDAVRRSDRVKALVAVTTDKVYENREWLWGYREIDRLGGFDPYSSSKACAEMVVSCVRNSYLPVDTYGSAHHTLIASARAGNVIGGGDWSEDRLIPDIAKATARDAPVVIRNPHAIRPWQHVLECLSGYLLLGARLLQGTRACADAFNFGPQAHDAITVGEMVRRMQAFWPQIQPAPNDEANAPHEAGYLKLDWTKAYDLLGWEPVWNGHTALERTARWYRDFYAQGQLDSEDDLDHYIQDAITRGAVWTT
jgi:CDP-glucose 4,6-dehydratase